MSYEKVFEFTAAIRGFHYYRRFWVPSPSQKLNCLYEPDNPFDEFAIKACEEGKYEAVGHLPREISRATKFFMDRGATVTATLISEHYRRSPLVQGGMEIACRVTVSIPGTCLNILLMERYKKLVEETYTEPRSEEILGSYLNNLRNEDMEDGVQKNKRRKQKDKAPTKDIPVKTVDIRTFFNPAIRIPDDARCKGGETGTIEID